jgi:hypothetical protein
MLGWLKPAPLSASNSGTGSSLSPLSHGVSITCRPCAVVFSWVQVQIELLGGSCEPVNSAWRSQI